MRYIWLSGLAFCALAPSSTLARATNGPAPATKTVELPPAARTEVALDRGWLFAKGDKPAQAIRFDTTGWQRVSVPHTWNRIGTYEPAAGIKAQRVIDPYMGVGWYRLELERPLLHEGDRVWLEFDAASRRADVWLNGQLLGSHEGGFSRFRFDATRAFVPGKNVLAVRVDNSRPQPQSATADNLPLAGDFFVQGGLYRPARIVVTSATHFALNDLGGSGVYATTERISTGAARMSVRSKISNDGVAPTIGTLVTQLVAADGRVAAEANTPVRLPTGGTQEIRQDLDVVGARLWQGIKDPYLYTLRSELRDRKDRRLDGLEQAFGIREIKIDPEKGLYLNGQHISLHGVGYHQDDMESGWAMSEAQVADRFATLRDMGANTIRLTHYQHGQAIHDLADKYGLILWDEIGLVTAWTLDEAQGSAPAGIVAQARRQLQEMIRQNFNHPSVAVWGIANEVDFGPSRPDFLGRPVAKPTDPAPLLRELNTLAIREDPDRRTTLATCCEDRGMPDVPDVAGITQTSASNRYFGWYYDRPEGLGPHLDGLHGRRPAQPQALSEYGAGGALSIHTDDPLGGPVDMGGRNQPEEYQAWLHEKTWPQIAARPFLWASWLWNSFDFATVTRMEGDAHDINTKGLVSYDGTVRKDAFYYFRANWSELPTVHINGRRYLDRAYPVADVRVYSNAPSTKLIVNGRAIGFLSNCPYQTCVWPDVHLSPGENRIEAEASFEKGRQTDAITWHLDPAKANTYRIDAGALVAARGVQETFGSDAFFSGGNAGSADQRPRGRQAIPAPITPAENRDVLATYREGVFGYRLPLDNGRYTVTLEFIEPTSGKERRTFDVTANGTAKLKGLDVAKLAGAPLVQVTRSFEVQVKRGTLDLEFVPRKGKAIVSAITVQPTALRRKGGV